MVKIDGLRHSGPTSRSVLPASGRPQSVYLDKAKSVLDGGEELYHKVRFGNGLVHYYFNAKKHANLIVTPERCDYYEQSLCEPSTNLRKVESYSEACLSLHRVEDDNGTLICDCKRFYRDACCLHVTCVRYFRGELNIPGLTSRLAVVAKPGRKRKSRGALSKDDAGPSKKRQAGTAKHMPGKGSKSGSQGKRVAVRRAQ